MIEIAFSLAIIGFALVAIIGVLPYGMNVQKDNREETVINQDATVFMNAIRNGVMGLDDLTNYVVAITNVVYRYDYSKMTSPTLVGRYGYTRTSSSTTPQFPLINGFRIVGLLSTPKYVALPSAKPPGFLSNNVVAYVRSMSGPAGEKFPQVNADMQDLAFSYRLTTEVVPYGTFSDPSWTVPVIDTNYAKVVNNLSLNLYDLRLFFRWPLRSQGKSGASGQSFRTLVSGQLLSGIEPGYPGRLEFSNYFFQPRTYVKAP
jgi:type II secretory pathway pseudopilin PulG